jgi:transcriptional regulator with XRE-family HTH domain
LLTRIREVRKSRGMTLQQVADGCLPPTTPQTIGRLETGIRTVSVPWLNRIAGALGVDAGELVTRPEQSDVPILATLDADGTHGSASPPPALLPRPAAGTVAIRVVGAVGEYRSGDDIWLRRLTPEDYAGALNRDLLVPRPDDRFLFARLIGREGQRLQLLPFGTGQRQTVVSDPPWAAVAVKLIRDL